MYIIPIPITLIICDRAKHMRIWAKQRYRIRTVDVQEVVLIIMYKAKLLNALSNI